MQDEITARNMRKMRHFHGASLRESVIQGKNSPSPFDLVSLGSNWRRGEKTRKKERREKKRGRVRNVNVNKESVKERKGHLGRPKERLARIALQHSNCLNSRCRTSSS